jgi:hypothetical protein
LPGPLTAQFNLVGDAVPLAGKFRFAAVDGYRHNAMPFPLIKLKEYI